MKVILRPLNEGDLPKRAEWTRDPELSALMGGRGADEEVVEQSHDEEVESNRRWFAARRKAGVSPHAIEVDGAYIGDVDYDIFPEERKAELTLFLGDRSMWAKGYGTEAAELVIGELFRDARVDFIEVDVVPGNDRALGFWRRLGFVEARVDKRGMRWLRIKRPGSTKAGILET